MDAPFYRLTVLAYLSPEDGSTAVFVMVSILDLGITVTHSECREP